MIETKWPRLLVVGEPVTPAQADEILIRTNNWWLMGCNEPAWETMVNRAAGEISGFPERPDDKLRGETWSAAYGEYYSKLALWLKDLGILNLEYLSNRRIMSSYIGGPHGWCNWDGRIGCNTYNLGKWPKDPVLTAEWLAIADAFPYLRLTAQCIEEEGAGTLAAEWKLTEGCVEYNGKPVERIDEPKELTDSRILTSLLLAGHGGDRGVDEDRLRTALQRVKDSRLGRE